MWRQSIVPRTAATMLLLVLAACGDGDSDSMARERADAGFRQAASDSFITRVAALIAENSDTAEPQDVGPVQPTEPEDAEPVPLS